MLLIGSRAKNTILKNRTYVPDYDYMCTADEFEYFISTNDVSIKKRTSDYAHVVRDKDSSNIEFYFGHDNNSTEQLLQYCNSVPNEIKPADLNVLYAIKMSHRFLRNSPHFLKTMNDINNMKSFGANMDDPVLHSIFKLREKETYNYSHPVLNQSKKDFFSDDGIDYIFDHDSIHVAVAIKDKPAYTNYILADADVMTSKDKFFACSEDIRLLGVYEETCVLALERSQIPFNFNPTPKHSFITALIKVCTSITSGWFREYAYENFNTIITMYRQYGECDYLKRFVDNSSVLKKYGE